MKSFNLEEAKAGKPVCTRDGRKARIICFEARIDVEKNKRLITLVTEDDGYERVLSHDIRGRNMSLSESVYDLMMCEATDTLPKSWEEFCKNYPIKDAECYLDEDSRICERFDGDRDEQFDKNVFRTKEQAEAMLAFIQLIRLRDVYRQGWEPNWIENAGKYSIEIYENDITKYDNTYCSRSLSFQSKEIRDKFMENFRDLIEQAKEFI